MPWLDSKGRYRPESALRRANEPAWTWVPVRASRRARAHVRKTPATRLSQNDLYLLDELLTTDEGSRYFGSKKVRRKIGRMLEEGRR
jgi:hypothetical protein